MKKTFVCILTVFVLCLCPMACSAETAEFNEYYQAQYEASGMEDIKELLPEDVQEKLQDFEIFENSFSVNENFTPSNIFVELLEFFKSGFKLPFSVGCSILAILLFSTLANGFIKNEKTVEYVVSIGITAAAVIPAVEVVESCISAIKASGVFMVAFVPVFAAILSSRGKAITAAGFSTVMIATCEIITGLVSFFIVPLTSVQLALGISSSVSADVNTSSLNRTVKKASTWTLSLVSTILLGILGAQTVISVPADNLTAKTAKFVVGTTVPVVGTAVSEAFSTVRGCLKVLSSSSSIYAVIALTLIFVPVIIELILWRVSLLLCSSTAEKLSQEKAASLIKAVDSCIAFILGIIVLIAVLFIISLTVVAIV